jgi:hypothetical protein
MVMTRRIPSVTHRPAVLFLDREGRILIVVAGHALGVLATLHVSRKAAAEDRTGAETPSDA